MLRNKRYNYACREIEQCEKMNKTLKEEIKFLKKNLTSLKNNLLVQNKDKEGKEIDIELNKNQEEEIKITEEEKEKNRNLLELGKKYNDVEKTYQLVLQNISSLVEEEKQNPLNVQMDKEGNDEGGNENQFELTSDELKNYDEIEVKREERLDLDKYNLNDEENEIVNNVKKLSDKDINDLESIELIELNNIIRRDEENNNLTEEKRQIIEEILSVELTEEENNRAKKIELTEDEEKIATQKLKSDEKELTSEKKQQRLEEFRILKIKIRKYLLQEKQANAAYKIKKMKKQKEDLVKNYEILLKKIAKTFDALYLCHSKQEFINMMKEKKIEISDNIPMRKSQTKRPTKKLTKKVKRRSSVNRRYIKTDNLIAPPENKDEEDDKSNYDPDLKILNKFLKEQNKEKENFIAGKIKLPEEKNN